MLKRIPPVINADLLWVLRAMGHGDDLALVDRNFPAESVARHTAYGKPNFLPGVNIPEAAGAILQLMPLDTFVEAPVQHMQVVGDPQAMLEVHSDLLAVCNKQSESSVVMQSIERFDFYAAARKSFAVVQTTEDRPYGCFILKKGVVFD